MFVCADSSEDTIPEELSKHLERVLDKDLHKFIAHLNASYTVSIRRHMLESSKSLMAMNTVISFNRLMRKFFSNWLQDPELFSDRVITSC